MPTLSFDLISMSTLTWITEKELERELKTKGDQFRWKKNKKKFIAAVRKRGNISRQQGENEQQRKKSEQVEHVHFLRKTCNWEVSGSFTFYSFKTTAKKCTKKRAKLFFAN